MARIMLPCNNMNSRIKELKLHIADLNHILADATGKQKDKIAGELLNSRFELVQLLAKHNPLKPVVSL
jgi:hypothetical protein